MSQSCLVLNASFEPQIMLPVRKALRLVLQGKAEIVEEDAGRALRSERRAVPAPVVIRLVRFVKVPRRFRQKVTNQFLYARDGYRCQYCGRHESELGTHKGHREVLNRDHVLPQSRGGGNTWENCVTSCSTCNSRKDNKTPKEAGMTLRSVPTEPHLVQLKWTVRRLTPMQRKYVEEFYGADAVRALS
jgi:5-methylcytosine-specific restriction endonuclease McrA